MQYNEIILSCKIIYLYSQVDASDVLVLLSIFACSKCVNELYYIFKIRKKTCNVLLIVFVLCVVFLFINILALYCKYKQ